MRHCDTETDVMRVEVKALRHKVLVTRVVVEKILKSIGRKYYQLRPVDELRLLTLAVWAERYKVSLEFVVTTLVTFWSKVVRAKARGGIGVKIWTLVGKKSHEVLLEEIARQYPNKENEDEWRWKKRLQQVEANPRGLVRVATVLDTDNVADFCKIYSKRMTRRGRLIDRATSSVLKRRRAYRGNPWL
jgi:hypothetical protein